MKKVFDLHCPISREVMTAVRLATGAVCSLAGLDLDRGEDCKVCVTESLLLLTHEGFSEANVHFSWVDRLETDEEGGRLRGIAFSFGKQV